MALNAVLRAAKSAGWHQINPTPKGCDAAVVRAFRPDTLTFMSLTPGDASLGFRTIILLAMFKWHLFPKKAVQEIHHSAWDKFGVGEISVSEDLETPNAGGAFRRVRLSTLFPGLLVSPPLPKGAGLEIVHRLEMLDASLRRTQLLLEHLGKPMRIE